MMEKLGVVLDDEKTKTAEKTGQIKCPRCGADAPDCHCPNCGTEPFEKRPEAPVKGRFSADCNFDDQE
jgi:hypothetical protein